MFSMIVLAIPVIILFVIIFAAITMMYVKASPNRAIILSGLRREPRFLIGQGGIKIPALERADYLYLGQISVDIKTGQSVPTNDFINVRVDAVAKVAVAKDIEGRKIAALNFLNMNPEEIAVSLQDSLEGNMREIIGTLDLKDINTDRDSFSDQVVSKASKDMRNLGIDIISCNIQNVTDDNGLIVDLGADNTAKIKKDAAISRAQAERDVAIAQAAASKESNDAKVKAELEIAQRQTDLAIRKAELQKQSDIKRAEADAAYEIQNQEQQKSIQTATVNAEIAKTEREQELKQKQVAVREQELAAEIQKKADADKYAIEVKAQAELAKQQRDAEARLYIQQKEAEAQKAQAEAKKYAMEQEAAGIKAKGEAEAAAIRAKGEAEAAAMDKKAEAMKKYGKAAMAQMAIEILPQVAAEIAKPLTAIDKISIIGGGEDGASVGPIAGNVPLVLAKTFQSVKESTGVDLADIMRSESYDAKVTRNVNVTGDTTPEETAKMVAVAKALDEKNK
ncbi:flotillin family protein [Selenomonas caprae]|uniref:Flotillin n=2 Tax=Selenomonas TaxID=970 RepID=A0A1I3FFC5_SELRU|nr:MULTISPECIES: flotillin family protein [Selenomonas]MBQ1889482.1 flotillin family protein [Selenomonas sp.]TYZ28001.1 flotillin family protein [Selenomonas caprae]SFI09631.1 flotillin [Selenomonas ruminantium]